MDSDEALFERLIAGDLGAFDRLYARFERPLYGFIKSHLGDAREAEDVLHETFVTLLRERDKHPTVRSFRGWLYAVARNLCLNRLRSRKRASRALAAVSGAEALAALPATPERELEAREQAAALKRAAERLPSTLAEAYRLRAAGLSNDEVADLLGVPVGTVKSRMHEMVARLRQELTG
jgi:RNA polymerase sigma-70 factor, ECF subfamily